MLLFVARYRAQIKVETKLKAPSNIIQIYFQFFWYISVIQIVPNVFQCLNLFIYYPLCPVDCQNRGAAPSTMIASLPGGGTFFSRLETIKTMMVDTDLRGFGNSSMKLDLFTRETMVLDTMPRYNAGLPRSHVCGFMFTHSNISYPR